MSDNKRYYYLKLKDTFFDSDAMIVLENMPDGYLYSNILLKLYLRSLKDRGRLMFNDRIPYNSTILAQVTRHSVGVIEKAIKVFRDMGLVDVLDNGAIYMLDIQNFIGESSTEADRQRVYYNRIKDEQALLTDGTEKKPCKKPCKKSYKVSTPKIEIEKEIKKEREPASKKPYGEFQNVLLTDDERIRLADKMGAATRDDYIERVSEYLAEHPKKHYESHCATIQKWKRGDEEKFISAEAERPQLPDMRDIVYED
jgi:predicted phage replisome organizer